MKKSIKIVAVVVAALMLCLSLMSCDLFAKKLKGEYVCESTGLLTTTVVTLTFDGNEVTYESKVGNTIMATYEGTYEIDDDQITFAFVDDDGEPVSPLGKDRLSFSEKDNGNIVINSTEYTKSEK